MVEDGLMVDPIWRDRALRIGAGAKGGAGTAGNSRKAFRQ